MDNIAETEQKDSKTAEILMQIREAERKADEILEKAKTESEKIISGASTNSSKMLHSIEEQTRKENDKKISDFAGNAGIIKDEKIAEGKAIVKQVKLKAQKNTAKAVDFVLQKFQEMA